MNGFASVVAAGNLVRDPSLKYASTGTPICEFGIAVNKKYTKEGGELVEEVSFYDVVCFGKTAEVAGQWLQKGNPVALEGRLQQRRWETDDGQKRSKVEIVMERLHFLPSKQQGEGGGGQGDEQKGHEG